MPTTFELELRVDHEHAADESADETERLQPWAAANAGALSRACRLRATRNVRRRLRRPFFNKSLCLQILSLRSSCVWGPMAANACVPLLSIYSALLTGVFAQLARPLRRCLFRARVGGFIGACAGLLSTSGAQPRGGSTSSLVEVSAQTEVPVGER
jgi:hypothetical protein